MPLKSVLAEGDHPRALVRGTLIRHTGRWLARFGSSLQGCRMLEPIEIADGQVSELREAYANIVALEDRVEELARELERVRQQLQKEKLEHFRTQREMEAQAATDLRFRELATHLPQCVFEVDLAGRLTFVNQGAAKATGYTVADFEKGLNVLDLVRPGDRGRLARNMARVLRGEENPENEYALVRKDGTTFPVAVYPSPIIHGGVITGLRGIAIDITGEKAAEERLRASLQEKQTMLQDIHHRVKNNLAVVSSLISLQCEYAGDDAHRRMFEDTERRIRSMALAHEMLYQTEGLAHLSIKDYLENLVDHLAVSVAAPNADVSFMLKIEDLRLELDTAIPLGSMVTELVSNSLKHAFPMGRAGTIAICLRAIGNGKLELMVRDDGTGIPANVSLDKPRSLGLDLVRIFVRQVHGKIQFLSKNGTEVRVTFETAGSRKRSAP